MNDIVIDTNVLVHTGNVNNHYNKSAIKTMETVRRLDLYLCVDDVFNIDETKNTSVIGLEYIKHIRNLTPAYLFLLERITKLKIKQIRKKDFPGVKRKLNKKIINHQMKNTYDIAFVIVACGSASKTLISNDYDDFSENMRIYINNDFHVSILDSDEYALTNT
jgi:hypothetical protein